MVKLPILIVGKPYWRKRVEMDRERLMTGRIGEVAKSSDLSGIA
jgi:hypothetical protein